MLWESREAEDAREYLLGRGLSEATLRQFRVGYSPSAWDTVLNASRRAGFKNEEVNAAGLSTRGREGRLYDIFRGKIMFPLTDARGRVRGFGARAMREGQGPKYVNTREGEVFHKREQLFGLDQARAASAKAGSVVLAEGYTDVLALHQAGFGNAIAVMGTALAAEQAREIARLASVVLLCLDADAAGQQAAVRAASVLPERLELRVVPLPPGSDPADIVGEEGGADRMRGLLERSVPFARFQVERILAGGRDDDALTQVGSVIRPLPQGILRDELVKFASGRLGITPELVESAIRTAPPLSAAAGGPGGSGQRSSSAGYGPGSAGGSGEAGQGAPGGGSSRATNGARQALDRREQSERAFLALCVALPELGEQKLATADRDALFTSHLTRLAAERLRGHLDHPASVIGETPELAELIPELVLRAGQLDATPATLELEALQLDLHRLDREITAARTGGEGEVGTLARERQKVLDAIRHRLQ